MPPSVAAPLILALVESATGQPPVDRRLEPAVAWYTGTAGRMDDARAHELLLDGKRLVDDRPDRLPSWMVRRGPLGTLPDVIERVRQRLMRNHAPP